VVQYVTCALVAPDFDDGDSFDLKHFHAEAGSTHISGFFVLMLIALAASELQRRRA